MVLEGAIPGPPCALEQAPPQRLRSIRITGADAWRQKAPLRIVAFATGENTAPVLLPYDAELHAALPVLPGSWCAVEIRGHDGMLLGAAPSLALDGDQLPEATTRSRRRASFASRSPTPPARRSLAPWCGRHS